MPFMDLKIKPGFNSDITPYAAGKENIWIDGNLVRFRNGYPEQIGGWVRETDQNYLGNCRSMEEFVTLDGMKNLGLGTDYKYYVHTKTGESTGTLNDITPIKQTISPEARIAIELSDSVDIPTLHGGLHIQLFDTSIDIEAGDYITISGAVSVGEGAGLINANIINQTYQVLYKYIPSATNVNSIIIAPRTVESIETITQSGFYRPTYITTSRTGGRVFVSMPSGFQIVHEQRPNPIDAGSITDVPIVFPGSATPENTSLYRYWSSDNFGEDLIIVPRNGPVYYWDSTTPQERAVDIRSMTGADGKAPTIARGVLISERDRHILVYGCDSETSPGVQDSLLIRFSDQENPLVWGTTPENTAGELRVSSGSEIIGMISTRQQTLVFTDNALYTLQFVGPPFTFSLQKVAENITISGIESAVAVDDVVYWVGHDAFYMYDGQVKKIECTVKSFIFDQLVNSEIRKITSGSNAGFFEIWWFFPQNIIHNKVVENNAYLIYNYKENTWYYGYMKRTNWIDSGVFGNSVSAQHPTLYKQETGSVNTVENETYTIHSNIKSGNITLGAGDDYTFISRVIPDIDLTIDSVNNDPVGGPPRVDFTLNCIDFTNKNSLLSEVNCEKFKVNNDTTQVYLRGRGRSFAVKLESAFVKGTDWRMGIPRFDIKPDGKR